MRLSEAAKRMAGCSALGKRREQQPGARLTMARFTSPSWHMAPSKSWLQGSAVLKLFLDPFFLPRQQEAQDS